MKLSELNEQYQRPKRSPEEMAKVRSAPDYWRKELRKEFNALVKKFGATNTAIVFGSDHTVASIGGQTRVLASGPSSVISRDKRAEGLAHSLAKWLIKLTADYDVQAADGQNNFTFFGHVKDEKETITPSTSVTGLADFIWSTSGAPKRIKWLNNSPNHEKYPLLMNLYFIIQQRKNQDTIDKEDVK